MLATGQGIVKGAVVGTRATDKVLGWSFAAFYHTVTVTVHGHGPRSRAARCGNAVPVLSRGGRRIAPDGRGRGP
ncbi:MAG: hypothetical protein HY720_23160 [Planctomycetes bacterium]|nr:hypothetical protein [Planctomycetota bacterium]